MPLKQTWIFHLHTREYWVNPQQKKCGLLTECELNSRLNLFICATYPPSGTDLDITLNETPCNLCFSRSRSSTRHKKNLKFQGQGCHNCVERLMPYQITRQKQFRLRQESKFVTLLLNPKPDKKNNANISWQIWSISLRVCLIPPDGAASRFLRKKNERFSPFLSQVHSAQNRANNSIVSSSRSRCFFFFCNFFLKICKFQKAYGLQPKKKNWINCPALQPNFHPSKCQWPTPPHARAHTHTHARNLTLASNKSSWFGLWRHQIFLECIFQLMNCFHKTKRLLLFSVLGGFDGLKTTVSNDQKDASSVL